MNLDRWVAWATRNRTGMILVTLLTTFAGLALLIDRPKGTILEWFGIPFLAIGGAMFAWAVWPRGPISDEESTSLASHLIRWATWNGRIVRLFPAIGVGAILADLAFNATLSASPALLAEDTIVLLGAVSLIAYGYVPHRFARERDFVLTFLVILNGILVVPLLVARAYYSDFERSVDLYSWVALAPQTSAVLNLLGVSNTLHAVTGSSAPGLTFSPPNVGAQVTVVITTACSGIYSFGIFAAAFVAYVLTEYQRLTRRVWILFGLGFLTAYIANVLRMVVIVLVGYYTDSAETDLQNMLVAHSYAGWLIFLGWVALFWGVLLRLSPTPMVPGVVPTQAPRHGSTCVVCSASLTPSIPANRCPCGSIYHVACLRALEACPSCGRIVNYVSHTPNEAV